MLTTFNAVRLLDKKAKGVTLSSSISNNMFLRERVYPRPLPCVTALHDENVYQAATRFFGPEVSVRVQGSDFPNLCPVGYVLSEGYYRTVVFAQNFDNPEPLMIPERNFYTWSGAAPSDSEIREVLGRDVQIARRREHYQAYEAEGWQCFGYVTWAKDNGAFLSFPVYGINHDPGKGDYHTLLYVTGSVQRRSDGEEVIGIECVGEFFAEDHPTADRTAQDRLKQHTAHYPPTDYKLTWAVYDSRDDTPVGEGQYIGNIEGVPSPIVRLRDTDTRPRRRRVG